MSCGYIYVVSHPKMGKGERKVGGSLYHPFDLTARWERALGDGRPLRLHSMSFVSDINATLTDINTTLRRQKALNARAGTGTVKCVLKDHLTDPMRECLGRNHDVMEALFDSHTGLFCNPSDRLSGPPQALVDRLARQLEPHCRIGEKPLWDEPFTLGLIWSMLELQANQLHIPALYVPEMYRALAARLWGVRPSNSEMRDLLAVMGRNNVDYRLGCFAFSKLMRSALSRDIHAPEAYAHLERYIAHPGPFIDQIYLSYARSHYAKLSIQTLDGLIVVTRASFLAVLILLLEIVALGGGADATIRTMLTGFAFGLMLFAGNFFEHPDAARLMGCISVREWRKARRKLSRFDMTPLAPVPVTSETEPAALAA